MALLNLVNNNNYNVEVGDLGLTVLANNSYLLDNRTQEDLRRSVDLYSKISSGELVGQIGSVNLTVPQAIALIVGTNDVTNGIDVLTKLQFSKRLTFVEQMALEGSTDLGVKVVLNNFRIAEYIDLNDPSLSAMLDVLVGAGILSVQRKTEILTI